MKAGRTFRIPLLIAVWLGASVALAQPAPPPPKLEPLPEIPPPPGVSGDAELDSHYDFLRTTVSTLARGIFSSSRTRADSNSNHSHEP